MSIQQLQDQLGEFAKDIKLNLSAVLKEDAGLNLSQIAGIALSSAYATRNQKVISALQNEFSAQADEAILNAAKAAATLMAMNNIYYRAIHLMSDHEYQQMPAKLRMNFMMNPGIDKLDFEMYSLAVSAINGCGMCIDTHAKKLYQDGISKAAIQNVLRIAAVINATAQALSIE